MIKVLHFFKTYSPETMGGIEQVIFQIAEGGLHYGFESEVLYLSKQGSARNELVANHLTHRSKLDFHVASTGFSISVIRDFLELANQADIVHYHFPWPYMDFVHFISALKKPTVVSYHSDIVKQKFLLKLYQPLMKRFLSSVDCIVASSPNYCQSSPVLSFFKEKVHVVPYGLNRGTYPTALSERLAFWKKIFDGRFFLFVGALRYYKGISYLLKAAQMTGFPLVIVGGGYLEAELKDQALQLGLSNVYFLGQLPDEDKVALLELCYAFVFPSNLRSESFGISLLEAAMYGKAMISCEIGSGTTYINIAGETGLVVPPGDSLALAGAMRFLWSDPELTITMGKAAVRRYEEVFSHRSMINSYSNIYRSLL